jgi:VanZ family protein
MPLLHTPAFLLYWLPPLLWTAAILIVSGDLGSSRNTMSLLQWLLSWLPSMTPAKLAVVNHYLRKTGHALAYGVLYFLWFRAFRGQWRSRPGRACLGSLGLCLLLAMLDEGHQGFLASRSGSIYDVALDLSGSGLGALLTFTFWPRPPEVGADTGERRAGGRA